MFPESDTINFSSQISESVSSDASSFSVGSITGLDVQTHYQSRRISGAACLISLQQQPEFDT